MPLVRRKIPHDCGGESGGQNGSGRHVPDSSALAVAPPSASVKWPIAGTRRTHRSPGRCEYGRGCWACSAWSSRTCRSAMRASFVYGVDLGDATPGFSPRTGGPQQRPGARLSRSRAPRRGSDSRAQATYLVAVRRAQASALPSSTPRWRAQYRSDPAARPAPSPTAGTSRPLVHNSCTALGSNSME